MRPKNSKMPEILKEMSRLTDEIRKLRESIDKKSFVPPVYVPVYPPYNWPTPWARPQTPVQPYEITWVSRTTVTNPDAHVIYNDVGPLGQSVSNTCLTL